jgi:aquaporin Z
MKPRALIAEFIGTFALLFAGVGSAVMLLAIPNVDDTSKHLMIALAHGLAIAVCGSALGHISGGHFNPAVSFGMLLAKKIDLKTMLGYWLVQFAGAIVAVVCIKFATTGPGVSDLFDTAIGGIPGIRMVSTTSAMMLEAIGTFFLMLVVFGTAVDRRGPKAGAWFIGMTITTMIFTFGTVTGGSINPARWLGPAVVQMLFIDAATYIVGPLIGAALAALLYKFVLAPEEMADEPVAA